MVEFDPLLVGIVVGLLGIALWIVTNVHLVRTGRAIKADIDAKREETQEFVEEQLEGLQDGFKTELEAELKTVREELGGNVELDAAPLMEQIELVLVPKVQERVEQVKSALLGKLGYGVKALKAAGEGVAEIVGERAVEEAGFTAEWEARLAQYGIDDAWKKTHKTAALGFELIKEALNAGQPVSVVPGVPPGTKRVGPPKGFG